MQLATEVVHHNLAIAAFARLARWEAALTLLVEAPNKRVKADVVTYNSVGNACGRVGKWDQVMALFEEMQHRTVQPNVITYNTAIAACARGFQWRTALAIFSDLEPRHKCRLKSLKPDIVTFSAAITACQKVALWVVAFALMQQAQQSSGVVLDAVAFGAVISSLEKGHEWQRALLLLPELKRFSTHVGAVWARNATISACEKGLQWHRALTLLEEFGNARLPRTLVTFNATISACGGAWKWEHALYLFGTMPSRDIVSYVAAVAACEGGQQPQRALALFDEMRMQRFPPSAIACNATLGACEVALHWVGAIHALQSMQSANKRPDSLSLRSATAAVEGTGHILQLHRLLGASIQSSIRMLRRPFPVLLPRLDLEGHSAPSITDFRPMVVVAVELLGNSVAWFGWPLGREHCSVGAILAARRRIFGSCRNRPLPLAEHLWNHPAGGSWQDPGLHQPANVGTVLARDFLPELGFKEEEYTCDRERSALRHRIAHAVRATETKAQLGGLHSSARSGVPCARGLVAWLFLDLTLPNCLQTNVLDSCVVGSYG